LWHFAQNGEHFTGLKGGSVQFCSCNYPLAG
jgi:hypothetical protein